jgi:hypothetical protein
MRHDAAPHHIEVQIGRIEVRVAPSPAVSASPANGRRTDKGFAGYERMRNYLG